MKKLMILILSLVTIFVLSGCNDNNQTGLKTSPYLGGTTGITIDFAAGSPPEEVYDGGAYNFDISVILQNKGEFEVPQSDVNVKISGILASEFDTTESALSKNPSEDLFATEKNSEGDVIQGAPVYVEFTDLKHINELKGNQVYPIRADVCFNYETNAVATVCILEDNLDLTGTNVCENKGVKNVFNSGAPVQVVNFRQEPSGKDKVRYHFSVRHAGTGEIFKSKTTCDKSVKTDENKVWVEVTSNMGGTLKCSGLSDGTDTTGYIRLYGGEFIVMCSHEVATTTDYESTLNINLKYDYEIEKTSTLLVKHAAD
jgi:hypothetical protein